MKCKQKPFHGNKGVVGLTRWIEKTEFVFQISFCLEDYKVKFATYTLADATLSKWTNYKKTMGINVSNTVVWGELKQIMIEVYYP